MKELITPSESNLPPALNMKLVLHLADTIGDAKNCFYPHPVSVSSAQELQEAVRMDHVCAEYQGHRRSKANFLQSNVIVMDCDNDHTDNPDEWITPEKLNELMPDISYAIAFSRHHMLEKNGKAARPKFHVYFEIEPTRDTDYYVGLKRAIFNRYPFFDGNALDAARFIFGSNTGDAIWHAGATTIDQTDLIAITETTVKPKKKTPVKKPSDNLTDQTVTDAHDEAHNPPKIGNVIIAGTRNSSLSQFAGRVITCFGDTPVAWSLFFDKASRCVPLLSSKELFTIWGSAVRWYENTVSKKDGYVPPDQYNFVAMKALKPDDYSDIGEAKVLTRKYGKMIRYSDNTGFLVYNGIYWQESKQMAVGIMAEFLDLQLYAASLQVATAQQALIDSGVRQEYVTAGGKNLALAASNNDQQSLFGAYKDAQDYCKFIKKHRNNPFVLSSLEQAKPQLLVDISQLDEDPFLLNTPDATYDLRKGIAGKQDHNPADYLTKSTNASPGEDGKDLWLDTVNRVFLNDPELIDYVQRIIGTAVVGKVFSEALIISYGCGRNGKSTFWNTLARVLGSYSGMLSADVLTAGCRRNVKPEMAELKGKRLIIAAELEEGVRLNTSMVKQLCSTDEIAAEKKYKDPFKFLPTHTVVLYTNHLPKVGASDDGTWRRLIVIPFLAKIEGKSEIKNYTDYLVKNAGPYIMTWIIEGAKKAIEADFKLTPPKCVQDAIKQYREENDWLSHFLEDCCDEGDGLEQPSGELYTVYRDYSNRNGEYARSNADFYTALDNAGFQRQRRKSGRFILGLKLKSDYLEQHSEDPF